MRFLNLFLDWLHQLCLAVWLGGILVLGAIGAPGVFRAAKQMGHTQRGMTLFDFAGSVAASLFTRFNVLALIVGAVMLAAGIAYGVRTGFCRRRLAVRSILTGIAWAVSL